MHALARRPARRLLPFVGAAMLLLAATGQVAALSTYYPIQTLGNRGSDVRALQYLLRAAGQTVTVDGNFGTSTHTAVKRHQDAKGLPVTGLVNDPTWRSLTPNLSMGSSGDAVRALQRLLNDKRRAGLTVSGTYGSSTRDAVAAFQRHMTSSSSGSMDETTWRRLLWHFERPVWGSTSGLCDYSVGNGPANWGTGAAIGQMRTAAKRIYDAGYGRVAVGDIGFEHGGDIPGHDTHEQGLDVDLRLMRDGKNQCTNGTDYRLASYNRSATRALIKHIRAAAPGHVKLIYFNDPVLIGEGLTTRFPGHDNHLHVRYCEAWHPVIAYRCPAQTLDASATLELARNLPGDLATIGSVWAQLADPSIHAE
jgi:peptidoglycan hydrolase-like protein with peptidoglycan-binding domain